MAKRDPEKTARNKIINGLTDELKVLLPDVLKVTGFDSDYSLHGKIGGKYADYIDIKNEVINSSEHFISLWLQGYAESLKAKGDNMVGSSEYDTYLLLRKHKVFKDYLLLFLERTYLRNYESLSRKRPNVEEAEIWIGQTNANYGILVTPRFKNGFWENDKSEIRHFQKKFWTIGHVLETGLLIPGKDRRVRFDSVIKYLDFFRDIIVRNSGSKYEMEIAEHYAAYVLASPNPESVPLLIPEFRYEGIDVAHKYRLDFTIIDSVELNKVGFELSPWSSHGYLRKTASLNQTEINKIAQGNFEKEMRKHKDFFRKHGIFALIYTDEDLLDTAKIFEDMKRYLEPRSVGKQLKLHIMEDFFNKPMK